MGIVSFAFKTSLLGIASASAGCAYLAANTTLVNLPENDAWFKTKTYMKYNPKANPALVDDCIKKVPLNQLRPPLRDNEEALALEFCRGIWGRWGFLLQSNYHRRYDAPPGSEGHVWKTADLAVADYQPGLKFSNHFEVVENKGNEITVRCGGSPLTPGLRSSDGLVSISARIDRESQQAVLSLKSALFNSSGTFAKDAEHQVPPRIVIMHRWYVRALVQSGYGKVKA